MRTSKARFFSPLLIPILLASAFADEKVAATNPAPASSPPLFKGYGFLLSTFSAASDGLNSFGKGNETAPTAARPQTTAADRHTRSTFQIGQSRVGVVITPDPEVRGKIEFDFVDFSKASPTVAANPRVRIAKIEYIGLTDTVLFFGQDWDVFSPLNPMTYNPVGNLFQAGNSGFMRHQAGFQHRMDDFTLSAALGLPGSNITDTDTNLELSRLPSVSMSAAYSLGKNRIGVSAILARIIFNSQTELDHGVYGLNAFADFPAISDTLSLRAEMMYGQNLNNVGALTLAQGRLDGSMKEFGGWITARKECSEKNGFFGGVGFARVLDTSRVLAPSATDLGIERNLATRLGYDRALSAHLKAFLELSHFRTKYHAMSEVHATSATVGFQMPF